MQPRARRLIFLIRVYLRLCKSLKQLPHKWFCTQKSALKRNFVLHPCCCRRSTSCCPQRSSPVRSDRWTLGPRGASGINSAVGFSGALRLRLRVLPVAPASWTLQRRPGSPPWLRLWSAWWPGCTGCLDPALQPARQHTQGHVICSTYVLLRLRYGATHLI